MSKNNPNKTIDKREDYLDLNNNLLEILIKDATTSSSILWATDSYESNGENFTPLSHITIELVTGTYSTLIQPRFIKSKEEQLLRTREKAEVFTPLNIVKKMNEACETIQVAKNNWQEYVSLIKIEISCGEAPYIVSRYDPVSSSHELVPLVKRVGFLDNKLKAISKYCKNHDEWIAWSKIAFKSSYGYEWQGDSLLIARKNLLYTFIDYYKAKFKEVPSVELQKEIAEIIVWNIFQMDGLRYVIPMSCKNEKILIKGEQTLFEKKEDCIVEKPCVGCEKKTAQNHNGVYVKMMDWENDQIIRFADILTNN
jgi:hypothetical protein